MTFPFLVRKQWPGGYTLCQGDVGSGDIVSIGEKGANRINKAYVERGDDIALTAGTGVQSYTNKN